MNIKKDSLELSVNSPNSGEGVENIHSKFNSEEMTVSFNSKYLIDISSQIEDETIIMNLKEAGSPVLIRDLSDKNSYHVVMPMKIWFYSLKVIIRDFSFFSLSYHLIPREI